jgi:hypothetical protein
MIRRFRPVAVRTAIALGAVLVVAACDSKNTDDGTSAPTPPPAPPATAACPSAGVRLESGAVDAAMGTRAVQISLVSCDRQTHRVEGYPAVRTLDAARRQLSVRSVHGVAAVIGPLPAWSGAPRPVTIRPGHSASAVVVWRNTYDDTDQPPVTGSYLSVAIGTGVQLVAPDGGLDLGSTGRIGVSAWQTTP